LSSKKGEWYDFCKRISWDAPAVAKAFITKPLRPGQHLPEFRRQLAEEYGISTTTLNSASTRFGWTPLRREHQKKVRFVGEHADYPLEIGDFAQGNPTQEWLHEKHLQMMTLIRVKLEKSLEQISADDPEKLGKLIAAYERFRKIPAERPDDSPVITETKPIVEAGTDLEALEKDIEQYVPGLPPEMERERQAEAAKSRARAEREKDWVKRSEEWDEEFAGGRESQAD